MSGFTLVELLVSVAIFVFMTILLVAKYGNFNSSVLFTDQAYDVALAIRSAQTYGLGVTGQGTGVSAFQYPYGVDFSLTNNTITTFADTFPNNIVNYHYDDGQDQVIGKYTLTRGTTVFRLCVGTGPGPLCVPVSSLDIVFQRPNPDAHMGGVVMNGIPTCGVAVACTYAQATLEGIDGGTRIITIQQDGEISVQ